VNIDFLIDVKTSTSFDKISIVTPETCVFSYPKYDIGTTINISGVATKNITLNIRDIISEEIIINNGNWCYQWNTLGLYPGSYLITVNCGNVKDELLIKLIDVSNPDIKIIQPLDKTILNQELIKITGLASDNFQIKKVEVCIDTESKIASGTHSWSVYWDLNEFSPGDYKITTKAYDKSDFFAFDEIQVAINESGYSWGPIINAFYNEPQNPTNKSNVIIYANVTTNSPFKINKVILHWKYGSVINSDEMFKYGENPIQERHVEDPLKHLSNEPIYGFEIGQFPTGTNIIFWITAVDNANNRKSSYEKSVTIGIKQFNAFESSKLIKSSIGEQSIIKLHRIFHLILR